MPSAPIFAVGSSGLLAAALLAGMGLSDGDAAHNPWRDWSTLRLEVRSVPLMRGYVELRLDRESGARRLETEASARFFGARIARSRTLTLFDPDGGATREHHTYSRKRGRRYVFGEHGYTVEKLESDDFEAPADQWRVTSQNTFDYPPPDDDGTPRLYDYYGMLVRLRDEKLDKPGDTVRLWVATSKGPQPYRIVVGDSRRGERKYTDLTTGENVKATLLEFRLRVIPDDPENSDEGFLSMEGETEIWVEAESKTPVEIQGKVPKIPGRVELRLSGLD